MDKLKLQQRQRFMPTGMCVREEEDGKECRTIEGCAIVFNQETTLWDGKYEKVREVIAPSCVTKEFLAEQDIKLNLLHNREDSIARNNKGEGTLQLDLREDGLYFSVELPKCDLGDRCLELVKNGTYTGCSFEFYPKDWDEQVESMDDGRENVLITHTAFQRIDALTIAMDPAYEQTSVSAHEFQAREKQRETEDREADEAAKRAEEEKKMQERQRRMMQLEYEMEQLRKG